MDLNEALLAHKTTSADAEERSAAWLGHHRRKRERAQREDARTVAKDDESDGTSGLVSTPPPQDAAASERAAADALAEMTKRARIFTSLAEFVLESELGGKHNAARTIVGCDVQACVPVGMELVVERSAARPAAFANIVHVVSLTTNAPSTAVATAVSMPIAKYRTDLHLMNWSVDVGAGCLSRASREQKQMRLENARIACRRQKIDPVVAVPSLVGGTAQSKQLSLYGSNKQELSSIQALLACSDDDDD